MIAPGRGPLSYARQASLGKALPLYLYLIEQADADGDGRVDFAAFATLAELPERTVRHHRLLLVDLGEIECDHLGRYQILVWGRTPAPETPTTLPSNQLDTRQEMAATPTEAPAVDDAPGVSAPDAPAEATAPVELRQEMAATPAVAPVRPNASGQILPLAAPGTPRVRRFLAAGRPAPRPAPRATSLDLDVVDPSSSTPLGSETQPGDGVEEDPLSGDPDQILLNTITHAGLGTPQLAEIRRATPATPTAPASDDWGDLPDVDAELVELFGAAAGTGGTGLPDAAAAQHEGDIARLEAINRTRREQRGVGRSALAAVLPADVDAATEALLAWLRELARGDAAARAWLPQRDDADGGGLDGEAIRRQVAALAPKGVTVERLAEVVAYARGRGQTWGHACNTLHVHPSRRPATKRSAGAGQLPGGTETRPDVLRAKGETRRTW